MKSHDLARRGWVLFVVLAPCALAQKGQDKPVAPQPTVLEPEPPHFDGGVTQVELSQEAFRAQFRPDRQPQGAFSLEDQLATYAKAPVATQDPFYIWGREMYASGPLHDYPNFFGDMNPTQPHLMVFGDLRTAAGFGDNGDVEIARLATRANLDIDLKLTATERIHAFVRPFDKDGRIMSVDFGGDDGGEDEFVLDGNLDTLFFEGDLGPILQGASGKSNELDLPIAFGKMPLLFQNGVWLEDAFTGVATTIQAKNSGVLNIANADFTFFAGFDDVTSAAVSEAQDKDNRSRAEGGTKIVGLASFIETREGYAEIDFGYTSASDSDADYANFSAAWTKRYFHWLSNSVRVLFNFGQDLPGSDTADGALFLLENSFGTKEPYTLIPYLNVFYGVNSPQSLARAADAGGVLKNTGINFETDGLTRHPTLTADGHDVVGAAAGVEYLPNLFGAKHRQQIVVELAGLHPHGDDATALGDEFAIGGRYQFVIDETWILRADAMLGYREEDDDLAGFSIEIRKKF